MGGDEQLSESLSTNTHNFDSIWRTQDEIRTVVNAVLGECIYSLTYSLSYSWGKNGY
jgi:hypothetical protein